MTPEQKEQIKKLHYQILDKLGQCIVGTQDMEPGPIANLQAPCLIRSAMYDQIVLLHVLNQAEAK